MLIFNAQLGDNARVQEFYDVLLSHGKRTQEERGGQVVLLESLGRVVHSLGRSTEADLMP